MTHRNMKLISFNCRGIRSYNKRLKILTWLKKKKTDICLLQETYLTKDIIHTIDKQWGGKTIHSFGTNHSRGVSILFDSKLPVEILEQKSDTEGRKMVVNFKVYQEKYTLLCLYAPNDQRQRRTFFYDIQEWLHDWNLYTMLVGGDFNSILDQNMDLLGGSLATIDKNQAVRDLCAHFNLQDIFRHMHPTLKSFTRRRKTTARRLAYWLVETP